MADTRGIRFLKEKGVWFEVYEYDYQKRSDKSVAEIASEATGIPPEQMIKTLVVTFKDGGHAFVLMPANKQISMKKLAKTANQKSATMCKGADAERLTGYQMGGISPFGSRKQLPVFMDKSLENFEEVGINGGGRGVIIKVKMSDLKKLLNPTVSELAG